MTAFEVSVDGQRVCLSGVGEHGSLDAFICWIGDAGREPEFFLRIGGYGAIGEEHVHWTAPGIGVGSDIRVRIVQVDSVDPPTERVQYDKQGSEEYREHFRECSKSLTPHERKQLIQELIAELETSGQ
jgi:hypothetical protein